MGKNCHPSGQSKPTQRPSGATPPGGPLERPQHPGGKPGLPGFLSDAKGVKSLKSGGGMG